MSLKLSLEQKLTQQLIMTPQLRQLIELLPLSLLELENRIQTEMDNNPLLEREAPPADLVSLESQPTPKKRELEEVEDWLRYLEESPTHKPFSQLPEDMYVAEPSREPSLRDDLEWQIKVCKLSPFEKEIAWKILGNLDGEGYLRLTSEELEQLTEADTPTIEKVVKAIQRIGPPGIAARNLVECLLIQAKVNYPENYTLIEKILNLTLKELAAHRYADIARKLKMDEKEVMAAVNQITSLDPHPGQEFLDPCRYYISPDAEIVEEDGEYKIILNENWHSSLKINPFYRKLLGKKKELNKEERKYLEEKYQSACQLMDGLKRRHSTLYNVLESVLRVQRGFFDFGVTHIVPLTLRDVAEEIGVHETTVSRITRKKYVQTPRGLFSLKFFFGRGLKREDGEVAVKSVMDRISHIIMSETAAKPLSDREIANLLQREGVQIARRTVGKYRKLLKIDSTQRRRRIKKNKKLIIS